MNMLQPNNSGMITFDSHTARFTLRVAGVVLHHNHILAQWSERDDFWFLPGGRAELLESTPNTLMREMYEELGVEITIERLLWVVENFFVHRGKPGHEVGFYFLMTLPSGSDLYVLDEPILRSEDGQEIRFQWFSLDQLDTIMFYPTWLRAALHNLPHHIEHIVHIDEQSADTLARLNTA